MSRHSSEPGAGLWLLASISLVLPWIGAGAAVFGVARLLRGEPWGWQLLAGGIALVILDIIIDFAWAHRALSITDEPMLNDRASQLVGRSCVVSEAIAYGRGRVRLGDTVWEAEGEDAALGAECVVTGRRGTVLTVEPSREPRSDRSGDAGP